MSRLTCLLPLLLLGCGLFDEEQQPAAGDGSGTAGGPEALDPYQPENAPEPGMLPPPEQPQADPEEAPPAQPEPEGPAEPEDPPAEPEEDPEDPPAEPEEDPEEPPVEPEDPPAEPEDPPAEPEDPPAEPEVAPGIFGTDEDLRIAQLVWFELQDSYQHWPPYPGKAGYQESNAPHGAFVRFYLNRVARENAAEPGDNYMIVKENYAERHPDTLGSITVMRKIAGYNPEEGDWFFAKFGPEGELHTNPAGTPLAGRVGKDSEVGCIPCHSGAEGNDFFFSNDPPPVRVPDDAPFGTDSDTWLAALVWNEMEGYRQWGSYPGKEGFQDSDAPHGNYVRFFLNEAAAANPEQPGAQSLIIKENFADENEATLGAITVMKKIAGYSPEAGDWFFAKFNPDGTLGRNAEGWPLAGRVGLGGDMGCVPCHSGAEGGDFFFTND